jgi:transposase
MASLPCHVDGQFEYGRLWYSNALRIGLRDMPREGRTMRNRQQGLDTAESPRTPRRNQIVKFVGWDCASTTHDITVLDQAGGIVKRWACEHTEADLAQALHRLSQHGQPSTLPVIIERTSGLVIDRLLAAGHPVVPVHPTAFHAARPRWGASSAKSDPGDSYKLADYLRTDGHRLRRLERRRPNRAPRSPNAIEVVEGYRANGESGIGTGWRVTSSALTHAFE